jgi:hypothetical protein
MKVYIRVDDMEYWIDPLKAEHPTVPESTARVLGEVLRASADLIDPVQITEER